MGSNVLTEEQTRIIDEIKKLAFYDREEKIAVVFKAGQARGIAFFNQLFLQGIEIRQNPLEPVEFILTFREKNSVNSQQLRFNIHPNGSIEFDPTKDHVKESLRTSEQHAKSLEELEKISNFISSLRSSSPR